MNIGFLVPNQNQPEPDPVPVLETNFEDLEDEEETVDNICEKEDILKMCKSEDQSGKTLLELSFKGLAGYSRDSCRCGWMNYSDNKTNPADMETCGWKCEFEIEI